MKELGRLEASLIEDRDVLKWKVNLIRRDCILGWIKPVGS
jgi:hypothetical protein